MRIAIHKSSWGFSKDWIAYCEENSIPYKIVNCYSTTIVQDVEDSDIIMWHHHHTEAKDVLFAKQLLFALQQAGKFVFPNFNTSWYFDDKLGQKYLLEAVRAPIAPSYCFYNKKEAIEWVRETTFPKVFKLRGGAGSTNVQLVKSQGRAVQLIARAFGAGFSPYSKFGDLKENIRRLRLGKASFFEVLKSVRRIFYSTKFAKTVGHERGYILFQDFIKNNSFDIRIVTIGIRAFGIKRLVRTNDFRASGSGFLIYDPKQIDLQCVKVAFETSRKLNATVVAYDFVFDNNVPLIVEINYGYAHQAYFDCPGYWDSDLVWHEGKFNSADWIIQLAIDQFKSSLIQGSTKQ